MPWRCWQNRNGGLRNGDKRLLHSIRW